MLNYFPPIYPDELLYSVIGRFHAHLGAPPWRSTLAMLFGKRQVTADVDLPGLLNMLSLQLPPGRHLTVDRLILENTQFSYYTAFQPPATQRWALKRMRQGNVADVHIRLGLVAFRSGRAKRLRYCPRCLIEMAAQYGEYYWRREHQLPGVLVCPIHAVPLRESTVRLSRCSRHAYVLPDDQNCLPGAVGVVSPQLALREGALWRVATASAALLEAGAPSRSLGKWTTFYREAMNARGLAHSPGRMNQEALDAAMRDCFGDALGLLPGVMDGDRFRGDWLASMVRKQRRAVHPLYHLLLQDCLARLAPSQHPFGTGPWPCLSPLHGAGHQTAVVACQMHRNHGHRVGVFACTCGYVYTRSDETSSGERGHPRFLSYGPRLRPFLEELVESKCTLREIGRQLHLDPKTVGRVARQAGISLRWKSGRPQVQTSVPIRTTRVTRCLGSARSGRKSGISSSRDWRVVDEILRERITVAARCIRQRIPPVRVSMAEVERELDLRGWLAKRQSKLPQATSTLRSVTETVADFQRRRVAWLVREALSTAQPLQPWRVMRKAGLTACHLPMIGQILEVEITRSEARS
jgi:hypothetical protein